MPKIQNQIKFYKYITNAGVFALAVLSLLTLNILIPINFKSETAVATDALTSTTSLTLDVASSTAGVELLVTSDSGTFASTPSGSELSFDVATNNVTGYMLSISANSGTELANATAGTSFASLDPTNATVVAGITSATFDTSTYNNQWGFKPNYYKSTANSDKFYPSPTTNGVTLNKTGSANTANSSDTYTIAIGARATYAQPAGTYSNTYTLSAVGNYPAYAFNYLDASTSPATVITSETSISGGVNTNTSTIYAIPDLTVADISGYTFTGKWCSVDNSSDITSCSGTVYQYNGVDPIKSTYSLSTMDANAVNFYAIWEAQSFTIVYDGNSKFNFSGNTTNTVIYNSNRTSSTETVTRYSHTSNIDDTGTASGKYGNNLATRDIITIPGATSLNVTLYYSTEASYDYIYILSKANTLALLPKT